MAPFQAVYCQCDEELLSQQRWRTAVISMFCSVVFFQFLRNLIELAQIPFQEMCVQCEEQLQTKEDATQTLTCSPELLQTVSLCFFFFLYSWLTLEKMPG